MVLGQADLNPGYPTGLYAAILGGVAGAAIAGVLIYALFFHDTWEGDHRDQLIRMIAAANSESEAKQYGKAKILYDELFGLVGNREIRGGYLRDELARAKVTYTDVQAKVQRIHMRQDEERRRAEADRTRQLIPAPAAVLQSNTPQPGTDAMPPQVSAKDSAQIDGTEATPLVPAVAAAQKEADESRARAEQARQSFITAADAYSRQEEARIAEREQNIKRLRSEINELERRIAARNAAKQRSSETGSRQGTK